MPEIPKTYEPKEYEDKIYALWEKSGFFRPEADQPMAGNHQIKRKSYSNVLPPPNANGELHLGHACGYTVMDIFGRFRRMKGEKVLLLPGKDHAGILTQVVYERKIKEERNITRYDLGRDKFYRECYDFCIGRADYMRAQEKKIGISADWSREKFTLDPETLKVALETFVKMHQDGMIYRGERIINWCPRCATALSDLEVLHKENLGKLYYIKYPLLNAENDFITVATTRPETMLGDTAVAVNPKDKRYEKLVGQKVMLPIANREIPIVADRRIEMEFGTGAVKITPAHDPLDNKIAHDHNLETIQVINEKAEITEAGGKFAKQNVLEARKDIIKELQDLNLLEKIEDAKINISICERCKCVIEPLISQQWFINTDAKKYSIKKECLKAIKADKIKIYPESFKKNLLQWFDNLEDWCISRQIWWGPRIPVWYKKAQTPSQPSPLKGEGAMQSSQFSTLKGEGAMQSSQFSPLKGEGAIFVGVEKPKGEGWVQEEDTFDTWFTSGQWAFTTLGFPNGKDYKAFYPTDMMVMGRDILFFWAARMIMLSLYRTGKVPFKKLYFTGLVCDKEGQKMSKSKGNGIDPLQMIEKYGADALRLSLVMDTTPGIDSKLYEEKIESYRNYVTKIWNIYRYAVGSDSNFKLQEKISVKDLKNLSDKWIISRLEETIAAADKFLKSKNVSLAQEKIRKFIWDDFADWQIEISKIEKNTKVLGFVLDKILKLSHPFMPFVTEKIYQDLTGGKKMLMIQSWPKADQKLVNKKAEKEFQELQEIIGKIRNIRSSYHIDPVKIISAYGKDVKNKEIIEKLGRVKLGEKIDNGIAISGKNIKIVLDIASLIDIAKEKNKLQKEIADLENLIAKNSALLANKKFISSAPKEIVEQNKVKLIEYGEKLKNQKELLKNIEKI